MVSRRYVTLAVLVLAFSAFSVSLAQPVTDAQRPALDHPSAKAFFQVLDLIAERYMHSEVDEGALWRAATAALVDALPDRWSRYDDPVAVAINAADRAGSFTGIGVELGELTVGDSTRLVLRKVYTGSPAEAAGLRPGDAIASVDGRDVRFWLPGDLASVIRGPAGTTVSLVVDRPGEPAPLTFEVVRGTIEFPVVTSGMLPEQVGYVALYTFFLDDAYRRFYERYQELLDAGATALVLDLRDNEGGWLGEALLLVDEFLDMRPVWQEVHRGRAGTVYTRTRRASDLPLVVLVNSRTISAAEVVAAVLQAEGRAVIVGEPTAGKATSTPFYPLDDGGEVVLAHSDIRPMNGKRIEGVGVSPDVLAPDLRRSALVAASGSGVRPGHVVELVVDGVVVASTVAGVDGFDLVGVVGGGPYVPAGPAPHLGSDPALVVAFEEAKRLREAAAER